MSAGDSGVSRGVDVAVLVLLEDHNLALREPGEHHRRVVVTMN
jgi:hypothetical protein